MSYIPFLIILCLGSRVGNNTFRVGGGGLVRFSALQQNLGRIVSASGDL